MHAARKATKSYVTTHQLNTDQWKKILDYKKQKQLIALACQITFATLATWLVRTGNWERFSDYCTLSREDRNNHFSSP